MCYATGVRLTRLFVDNIPTTWGKAVAPLGFWVWLMVWGIRVAASDDAAKSVVTRVGHLGDVAVDVEAVGRGSQGSEEEETVCRECGRSLL